jgi:hypothetical protein
VVGATGFEEEKTVKWLCNQTIANIRMVTGYMPFYPNRATCPKRAGELSFYSIPTF